MTTQEIDALEKLCDGATPGPWKATGPCSTEFDKVEGPGFSDIAYDITGEGNAQFIAASRTALPALISEVRRLTERCEAAEKDITSLAAGEYGICDMCELCGDSKRTTPCPSGCYKDKYGNGRYITEYPDEPCDDFKYMRRGPQPQPKA